MIGKQLADLRQELGWTLKQMEKRTAINEKTLWSWENNPLKELKNEAAYTLRDALKMHILQGTLKRCVYKAFSALRSSGVALWLVEEVLHQETLLKAVLLPEAARVHDPEKEKADRILVSIEALDESVAKQSQVNKLLSKADGLPEKLKTQIKEAAEKKSAGIIVKQIERIDGSKVNVEDEVVCLTDKAKLKQQVDTLEKKAEKFRQELRFLVEKAAGQKRKEIKDFTGTEKQGGGKSREKQAKEQAADDEPDGPANGAHGAVVGGLQCDILVSVPSLTTWPLFHGETLNLAGRFISEHPWKRFPGQTSTFLGGKTCWSLLHMPHMIPWNSLLRPAMLLSFENKLSPEDDSVIIPDNDAQKCIYTLEDEALAKKLLKEFAEEIIPYMEMLDMISRKTS